MQERKTQDWKLTNRIRQFLKKFIVSELIGVEKGLMLSGTVEQHLTAGHAASKQAKREKDV